MGPTAIASAPDGRVLLGGEITAQADFGGGPVPGSVDGSLFLAYFGSYGDHLLSGSSGAASLVTRLAAGPEGDFYAGGVFTGAVDFGSGPMSGTGAGYFAAFDRNGAGQRSFPIAAQNGAWVDDLAATPSGDVFLCVDGDGATDVGGGAPGSPGQQQSILAAYGPDGHERWEARFGANITQQNRIAPTPGGDLYFASSSSQGTNEFAGQTIELAAYVGKVGSDGTPLWARVTTGSKTDVPFLTAVAADTEGNVFVSGTYREAFSLGGAALPAAQSAPDVFLIELNGDGEAVLAKSFAAGAGAFVPALAVSGDGEIVLAAATQAGIDFGQGRFGASSDPGVVLARFSHDGTLLRQQALQDEPSGGATVSAMALDPYGQPVLAGTFQRSLQLGFTVLTGNTLQNGWVARLPF